MLVLSPFAIADADFLPGSVPAVDTDAGEVAWATGQAITKGDKRNDGDSIYKAAADITAAANTAKPRDSELWQRIGATNRYASFDDEVESTQTGRKASLPYVWRAPFCKGLGIHNIKGNRIKISAYREDDNTPLMQPVDARLVVPRKGWYAYWRGKRTPVTSYQVRSILPSAQCVLSVEVQAGPDQEVGAGWISYGDWVTVGTSRIGNDVKPYGTNWGASLDINNRSILQDRGDGKFKLQRLGSSIDLQMTVVMRLSEAPYVVQMLRQIKDTPVSILAADVPGFGWLTTVGYIRMRLSATNSADVTGSADVRGII